MGEAKIVVIPQKNIVAAPKTTNNSPKEGVVILNYPKLLRKESHKAPKSKRPKSSSTKRKAY